MRVGGRARSQERERRSDDKGQSGVDFLHLVTLEPSGYFGGEEGLVLHSPQLILDVDDDDQGPRGSRGWNSSASPA